MNFAIHHIYLWLTNGTLRSLEFKRGKVNVITGDSGTGKSSIINIIDYVLMGSKANISEREINKNVRWYGLQFSINDKLYTIARERIVNGKPSESYYFSPTGETPSLPEANFPSVTLKAVLEKEFGINPDTRIPYGGKVLKPGSKISFRYFLLFTTQSYNILTSPDTMFDKQNDDRYQEALHRIFDLAVGIETVNNILISEKIDFIQKTLRRLDTKASTLNIAQSTFEEEQAELCARAKRLQLLDERLGVEDGIAALEAAIRAGDLTATVSTQPSRYDELRAQRVRTLVQLKKFNTFAQQYKQYRELAKNDADSLKPIEVLANRSDRLIDAPETAQLISELTASLSNIKAKVSSSPSNPVEVDLQERIAGLKKKVADLDREISETPNLDSPEALESVREQLMFLGELKAKLELYGSTTQEWDWEKRQVQLEEELAALVALQEGRPDRDAIYQLLNEKIQRYLNDAILEGYRDCRALFDPRTKVLNLRDGESAEVYQFSSIGSSSNYLFLHVCFFLGLHDLFASQKVEFSPSLLILDQVSSPYYVSIDGTEEKGFKKSDDKEKLTCVLSMLNQYVKWYREKFGREFQFIILEHIPEKYWKDEDLDEFVLVDREFRNGHKLVNM